MVHQICTPRNISYLRVPMKIIICVILIIMAISAYLTWGGFIALCFIVIILGIWLWDPADPSKSMTIMILGLTAVALVWNTVKVDQGTSRSLQQALRPVILPQGTYNNWHQPQGLKSQAFFLSVQTNIATHIAGYIVTDHQ